MSYFIKKTNNRKKGLYLQIYESFYIPGKGKRNKSFKPLGYVVDLQAQGIKDPIEHYQKEVDKLNEEYQQTKAIEATNVPIFKNIGYFLFKCMFDMLDIDNDINLASINYKSKYKFADMFRTLVYSQVVSPGSKLKAFENVIPSLFNVDTYSYDQILDAVNFLGTDYHKFIEILNKKISENWDRNYNKTYFDCTNYYFEIDLENDTLRKGPSKENRKNPLLGQALLLDADQIPLDTEFYPGNESEKPFLRKRIEDMKQRNNISGRVIQVADKGLNCARNIYSAVIEANDGYIFSKSLKGKNLDKENKDWVLKSDDELNQWVDVRDVDGTLIYRYKTVKHISKTGKIKDYAKFEYKCKINNDDTHDTKFVVKEKRIVTYNPSLAKKQKAEITKQIEKALGILSYKAAVKEDFGDSVKYVNLEAKDENGRKIKIAPSLNEEKIAEDLALAGYNMLITSEIDEDPKEIYRVYHNLWRIEESFRIMKSYLEARPVFLQKKNSIYGHFLICYTSLTILRLLELKIFKDEIPVGQIVKFIRDFNMAPLRDGTYLSSIIKTEYCEQIRKKLGLLKLCNVYLTKRDVEQILNAELD